MSAKKLLDILDRNGMLEEAVMAELRKQVAESKGKVGAETIAKVLVDKGHLTKFQATKLVGEATAGEPVEEPKAKKPARKSDDDLLGLAPLDEGDGAAATPAAGAAASAKSSPKDEEVVMLEDADALTPVEDAGAGLTPVGMDLLPADAIAEPSGFDPFSDGLTPAAAADPFAAPAAGAAGKAQLVKPKKREIRWDTKLMLGGFGFLFFLIFAGGVLYFSIFSEPVIKLWEAAEEAYNNGNFNDAKEKYEAYLARVGDDDPNSSKARVRMHLVKLRNDVGDPERGLKSAEQLLPLIDKEKDSSVARDEYPGILPQIAEGFIKRAQQAKDTQTSEELVAKAKQAREILHSPGTITSANRQKIQPQLTRIDEDIALLERDISEDKELAATIIAMGEAVEAADTPRGYQLYNDILRKYPGLKNDAGLNEAVAKIAARERTLVKVKQEVLTPETDDEARQSEFRVVLATRSAGDAKLQDQVATLRYGNSAYGLDAGTGQVLWSRYLGAGSRANPVRLTSQTDSDVLLVDLHRQELLRIKALDGKLVWRLPLGEPFTEPTVAGTRVYVATDSGRIVEIDAETGESKRHLAIPQRLTVSPVVAPDRPRMYQVGEHSNVYVIHSDSLQCEDVIYLGHKAGSIQTSPLILMGHVFITENPASDYALVHPLRIRSQGEGPKLFRPQGPVRTNGRIEVPLVAYGRRLLILTDRGEIRVFDVDSTKNEDTLTDTGKLTSTLPQPHIGYPLADGTTVWVADDKLTKYTVQVTRKEIIRDPAITNVGDSFVAPLQLFGNHLIHARRPAGSTGFTVACVHVDDPRKTVWQTQLGVPAGRITVDPAKREIMAISSSAALFQINGEVLKSGYADQPVQALPPDPQGMAFTEPVDLENGVVAFFNPENNARVLVYDPTLADARLKLVTMDLKGAKAACEPVALLGGLAVPTDSGEIPVIKAQDGSALVLPFQPKLEPGQKVQWRRPAVLAGGREMVVVDDQRNVYRLGVKEQPQPHLAELVSNKLDVDLVNGLAAAGETIYGVARLEKGDVVVALNGKDLKIAQQFDLQGARVTWGPVQVGDYVMVVSDAKELRLYDANLKERWEKPAAMKENPAGRPLVVGDAYYFAGVQGAVWGVVAAGGQEIPGPNLGEPLGAGPTAYQERLLLCGNDGTLHVVPAPSPSAATPTVPNPSTPAPATAATGS